MSSSRKRLSLLWLTRKARIVCAKASRSFKRAVRPFLSSCPSPPYRVKVPRFAVAFRQGIKGLSHSDRYRLTGELGPLTPARLSGTDYLRYRAELQRALRLPKVRNIAVTGGYGAGKSSFIQSFAEDHKEYKYCFISLAAFNSAGTDASVDALQSSGSADGIKDPIERVEATIVQQLLYSVKGSSIPQTRLKRINHVPPVKSTLYAIFAIGVAIAAIRQFGLPKGLNHLATEFPFQQILQSYLPIATAILVCAGFVVMKKLLSTAFNFNLQSISVKGVALAPSVVNSVLHKQLDEIVYLFERNKIDVVFIEDLDRFLDSSPFTRLREINFIINSSPSVRRPVHFVYMIRDDLFSAEDRVKFFDYVVPIVSVINTDNSKQKMLDIMRSRRWRRVNIPSEDLMDAVCYHVDDMRQVVNIINEYDLFTKVAGANKDLSKDKIFAAVVAKCLFPKEYACLLKGDGPILELIKCYKLWGVERSEINKLEIDRLETEAKSYDQGVARSEKELRVLVWMAASEMQPKHTLEAITLPNGERLGFNEFANRDSIWDTLDKEGDLTLHFPLYGDRTAGSKQLIGSGPNSLRARITATRAVAKGAHRQLASLRTKYAEERIVALSQAVKHPEFANYVAVYSGRLGLGPVGFLVSNGYLGEDYFDYSGFFYEGSISRADKAALLRIKAGELLPVETVIDNPSQVLKRLNEADLQEGRALVAGIMACLFEQRAQCPAVIEDQRAASIVNIGQHLNRVDEVLFALLGQDAWGSLVRALLKSSGSLLVSVLEQGNYCSQSPWREVLCAAIVSDPAADNNEIGVEVAERLDVILGGLTDGVSFAKAITNRSQAKSWLDENVTWLRQLDDGLDADSLDVLLKLNCVDVNLHNIRVIGRASAVCWPDVLTLAAIRSLPKGLVRERLTRVPKSLVEAILEQEGEIEDEGASLEWAFATMRGEYELKQKLINRVSFVIANIADVDSKLWLDLLIHNRIQPSWSNLRSILETLESDVLDGPLQKFISRPDVELSMADTIEDLASLSAEEVSEIVERFLRAAGEGEAAAASFLAHTGALALLASDDVPSLSPESFDAIANGLKGRWISWVFTGIQSSNQLHCAKYLADCVNNGQLVTGVEKMLADVVTSAVDQVQGAEARAHLLDECLPLVSDWTDRTAQMIVEVAMQLESEVEGSVAALFLNNVGLQLLPHASVEDSMRVLVVLLANGRWDAVRGHLLVAGNGFLSQLDNIGSAVSLSRSDNALPFALALYKLEVIRKPSFGARRISIQSSAKFRA